MLPAVRPTKRCLDELSIDIPDLDTRLSDLRHPIVLKSQRMPSEVSTGAAERIRSLTDRTWFKVKTGPWRGAVVDLADDTPEELAALAARWWLGAAGRRVEDSTHRDFYSQLSDAAHRAGPHSCSTDHLLPGDWDEKRLRAEAASSAQLVLGTLVRTAAAQSLLNGDIRGFVVAERDVRVRAKLHLDGEVYIAIGATASHDPSFFAVLLSAVPGVPLGDWLPEPEGGIGIEPAPGEIVWSAMLSAEAQAELLEELERE